MLRIIPGQFQSLYRYLKKPILMNLKSFGLSFQGRRSNNEDAFLNLKITDDLLIAAVADGMGGTTGGEIASNTIISGLNEFFTHRIPDIIKESDLKTLLTDAVKYSRKKLDEKLENDSSLVGMGTTLTAALIYKDKFVWCNIGDSRLYRINDEIIELLSKDHSYIQQHID